MRRSACLPVLLAGLLLGACRPATGAAAPQAPDVALLRATPTPAAEPATIASAPTAVPPASPTPRPTATVTPTPSATPTPRPSPTPTVTPTATPIGPCSARVPSDDLLTLVTLTYGLSRAYRPADLVSLDHYFDQEVTLGYPTEVRAILIEPLTRLIADMRAAGLHPFIISGFRSYDQQATARQKWVERYPERVNILSAPPGFSEHQLGTALDFGSPELPDIVGDPEIEFHTYFYQTSEGQWLLQNAAEYGLTLSYTRAAQEITGFFYEPWHFRYVGREMALMLQDAGMTLTDYLLANEPAPCVP